jgi:hypothetical protein
LSGFVWGSDKKFQKRKRCRTFPIPITKYACYGIENSRYIFTYPAEQNASPLRAEMWKNVDGTSFTMYGKGMIKKPSPKDVVTNESLKEILKENFISKDDLKNLATKDSLKETLKDTFNDMRSQIVDSFDGKLKATERNILESVDKKFQDQNKYFDKKLDELHIDIIKDVAHTVAPLFDQQDENFSKSKPKN